MNAYKPVRAIVRLYLNEGERFHDFQIPVKKKNMKLITINKLYIEDTRDLCFRSKKEKKDIYYKTFIYITLESFSQRFHYFCRVTEIKL